MVKSKGLSFEAVAKVCRRYGIRKFKCKDFEFELGDSTAPVGIMLSPSAETNPKFDFDALKNQMPSDDELLFAATEGIGGKDGKKARD